MFTSIYNYFFGEPEQYETIFNIDEEEINTMIEVKESILKNNRNGCFTSVAIPVGYYTEYEGKFVKEDPHNEFAWPIYNYDKFTNEVVDGNIIGYIDGSQSDDWTKHVNYINDEDRANLGVYQYANKIYYQVYKDIEAGGELIMACTDEYYEYIINKNSAETV